MNVTGAGHCGKLSGAQGSGGRPGRGRWRRRVWRCRHAPGRIPLCEPAPAPPPPRRAGCKIKPVHKNSAGKAMCARLVLWLVARACLFPFRGRGCRRRGGTTSQQRARRGGERTEGLSLRGCRATLQTAAARRVIERVSTVEVEGQKCMVYFQKRLFLQLRKVKDCKFCLRSLQRWDRSIANGDGPAAD